MAPCAWLVLADGIPSLLVHNALRFTHATIVQFQLFLAPVPPHFLRGNNGDTSLPKVEDIVFDGGFTNKEEAESFGVRPGDIIVPQSEAILTANQRISSLKLGIIATVSSW